ncbi:hypothetical protein GCM10011506_26970 [Marivirga lumbricoides]|uniref:DUF4062 domain-containing protein n=1 Tax=Marivirga lumbricoides TaxID=1046115 RepID=A0ABQ1MG03_9BACT|nr:hypothetical protein GCM10011506_26970 [Marivirga lumbricoides]
MKKKLVINIYFAENDNVAILKNNGWVSYFRKFLMMTLRQTSDVAFQTELVSDQEKEPIAAGDINIAILSQNFITSGICLDRIEQLFNSENSSNSTHRIFTVFKTPLEYTQVPEKLKPLTKYALYGKNDGAEHNFIDFFSIEAQKNYWMKMVDLCFDIYETMLSIHSVEEDRLPEVYKRKAVYLSETGQDLAGARNIIKRELTRHGYEVYPKSNLPHDYQNLKNRIATDLSNCQFSLHMVGSSYGYIPDGIDISVPDLQNEMAAERAREKPIEINRLIWISPSLSFASEKQKTFIHHLKRDEMASSGAEILQTSLEDFKNTLWEELLDEGLNKKLRQAKSLEHESKPTIYFVYDLIDDEKVKPIIASLAGFNIKIITPSHKGDLMERRNHHIDALKQMDAAIVFQGLVNEQWVHMKLLDLLKAPGFGRYKPVLGKLFLTTNPNAIDEGYQTRYEVTLDNSQTFQKLEQFIKQIKDAYAKAQSLIEQ